MKKRLFALLFACPLLAQAAVSELAGTTPAGSAYRIGVPDGWQPGDGLVLVQHGHRFAKVIEPNFGPSANAMFADGYAIAAVGYRQTGWAVKHGVDDNVDVLAAFRTRVGEPGAVIAHGGSMGALIALKMAEDDRLKPRIDAVVALCPASDGVDFWDRIFDLRVVYDALCKEVPGGALPPGDAPTPFASNLDVLASVPTDALALPATMRSHPSVRACLALDRPAAQRTADQNARVASLTAFVKSDEETLAALLAYAYFGLADQLRSPDKLAGRNPFHTEQVQYRSPAMPADIDARALDVARDGFARLDFHRTDSLRGSVDVPVIAAQTSRDGTQRPGNLGVLRRRLGDNVVPIVAAEAVPTHCGFTQREYDLAWEHGRAAAEGAVPTTASIAAECANGACRFETGATSTALAQGFDEPRRPLALRTDDVRNRGGLWWDTTRPAQGLLIEELDTPVGTLGEGEQRVAVNWYTWAPANDPNPGPRWFHGIGIAFESEISVDLVEVRGGRFGVLLDPAAITYAPWGRVEISFKGDKGAARYAGPPGYGNGTLQLVNLVPAMTGLGGGVAFSPPPGYDFTRAGTYYDPVHPAGGWVLNQHTSDRGAISSFLVWFTWDANGRPLWMYGIDDRAEDGLFFRMQWAMSGGRFEPGYALSDVNFRAWGDVALQSEGCGESARIVQVDWRADTHGFGDGHVPVARLTRPRDLHSVVQCPP